MSDTSDDSDYEPPTSVEQISDDDSEHTAPARKSGYSEITKLQEEQLKKIAELGELKTESILEIQYLEKLIHESKMNDQQKYQTGKCLEMLINCSNAYINSFASR